MSRVTFIEEDVFYVNPDAIILPVPARVKSKKVDKFLLPQVNEIFSKLSVSKDRYVHFSREASDFYNGQIELYRDADFFSINVQDESIPVDEIVRRIEEQSKIIVILPIKSNEHSEESELIYMSGLRTLQILLTDEELKTQCRTLSIVNFPGLSESIEKVKELFCEADLEIFICDGSI